MQRRLIIAALVVLVWLPLAQAGDAPPGVSPEAAKIMEKMQAGQMPTAEEMKIFEQATQDMAASMQGLAPSTGTPIGQGLTPSTVPTQGKSLLDLSDGYDQKIEFPTWPDIATFDQLVAGEAVIQQWRNDSYSWNFPVPLTPGFKKRTGNWDMFEGAGKTFHHYTENQWREHHERSRLIDEKANLGLEQRARDWEKELYSLMERQGNLEEHKQLQIEHSKRALAAARSDYADSYNSWKKLRDGIFYECQDYHWVCSGWIAEISHVSAEHQSMNIMRASAIVSEVGSVAWAHPASMGGGDLNNSLWLKPGPLTLEELKKMFLEPGAPQAGNARWRIPSTPGFDDPLRPLEPVPDKGPPDPLAPLPPVLDKGPPDPLAPLDPLPTQKPASTKTKTPAKAKAKPRAPGK